MRVCSAEVYDPGLAAGPLGFPSPGVDLQLPQLADLIPQGRRLLELQALGGGFHLFFKTSDALGER